MQGGMSAHNPGPFTSVERRITRLVMAAVVVPGLLIGGVLVVGEFQSVNARVRYGLERRAASVRNRLDGLIRQIELAEQAAAAAPGFRHWDVHRQSRELSRMFSLLGMEFNDARSVRTPAQGEKVRLGVCRLSLTRCGSSGGMAAMAMGGMGATAGGGMGEISRGGMGATAARGIGEKAMGGMGGHDIVLALTLRRAGRGTEGLLVSSCFSALDDMLDTSRFGGHGEVLVADARGHVLARSGADEGPDVRLPRSEAAVFRYRSAGVAMLAARSNVPRLGWVIVAQQPIDEAMAPVRRSAAAATAGLLMAIAVFAVAAARRARPITQALSELRRGAEHLGAGRMETRVCVDSGDDLEILAQAYNRMADTIQARDAAIAAQVVQLEAANQSLQCAVERRQRLLAAVSHDIRSPLQGIIGCVQLARLQQGTSLPPALREDLDLVEMAGHQILRLANDLLDLSRLESGRVAFNQQPTPAGRLLDDAARLLRPLAEEKRIQVSVTAGRESVEVVADPQRILQVLQNLVSNAVKFTPSRGRVVLAVESAGDEACFRVTDSGVGIRPEDMHRLFEEFERLDTQVEGQTVPGTGLGLSLVRRIVEGHGGRVAVASVPGQGSTFSFTLPMASVGDQGATGASRAAATA